MLGVCQERFEHASILCLVCAFRFICLVDRLKVPARSSAVSLLNLKLAICRGYSEALLQSIVLFYLVQLLLHTDRVQRLQVELLQMILVATFSLLVQVELHFARQGRGRAIGVHDCVVACKQIVLRKRCEGLGATTGIVTLFVRSHRIRVLLLLRYLIRSRFRLLKTAREPLDLMFQLADLVQCFQCILIREIVRLGVRLLLLLGAGAGLQLLGFSGCGWLL